MRKNNRVQSEFNSPQESPGYLLWRVSNSWQKEIRNSLKALDLTHVQFVLLACVVWLEDAGHAVSQAVLANHAAVDKMVVSDVVRTLEKKKLLLRKRDSNDRRTINIYSTPFGVKLIPKAIKAVEKVDRVFFTRAQLSLDKILEVLHGLSF